MKKIFIINLLALAFTSVFAQENEEDKQPMSLEVNKTEITCFGSNNATVSITIFGGFGPYAVNGNPISGNVFNVFDLGPGEYEYFITDIYMSNATAFVTFVQPSEIVISAEITNASNNLAYDGNILILNGEDYTYEWFGPSGVNVDTYSKDQFNLPSGTYHVNVSNGNGCEVEYSFVVGAETNIENVFGGFTPLSIESEFATNDPDMLIFFPNPANQKVTFNKSEIGEQTYIYNSNGNLVLEMNTAHSIETIDLPHGIYRVVRHKKDGSLKTEQLIMQ